MRVDKMASKWVKVSEGGNRVIVDSKKKRVSQIIKASNRALGVRPLFNKTQKKKKRDNGCKSTCHSSSLLKNYSNFMKSGLPKRVLFSEDGDWKDFPQDVIELIKEGFLAKTISIEVRFNGCHLMLDILHMIELDLKTGARKPIAWIDEKGSCFFPEFNSGCHENNHHLKKDLEQVEIDPEIKLHIEIELNEISNNCFEECVEESNVKRVNVDQEGQAKADQCVEKIQIDEESVRNMFIKSLNSTMKVDIIEVKKCSVMEGRLDLFQTQVEITEKLRGNANVKYAWFVTHAGAPSSTWVYGLGHDGLKLGSYGYGVHLTAVQSAHNSDTIYDVDEKGIGCMVLCRVILGNPELILSGSKQFYPSNGSFDSGVDNLQNPNHYVVWNMNMNTHIHPEYAVSFKMSPRVTTQDLHALPPLQIASSPSKLVPSAGSSSSRAPNSPWMPFSKLFEAISDKVNPDNMKLVMIFYESLKGKKTSREEFIKKLRAIVGDQILRSTISSLQSRV